MSGEPKKVRTCDECGVTIQREDFLNHAAVRYKGKLLCPACVQAVKSKLAAEKQPEPMTGGDYDPIEVPIALVGEDKPRIVAGPSDQIHGFSGAEMLAKTAEHEYKRPLLHDTQAATRCRTFHCKLTDASFANLNEQINEWVDEHEDIEIKFALSSIGVVEGKHADPHLIVTVFY
ncbi:MAG: hypothetical protein KKI02_09205 [Planctomycetes bacterium]|nr:hypothetical protein [Planctomycetota bacterium]